MDENSYEKRVLISIPTRGEIRAEAVGWIVNTLRRGPQEGYHAGMQILVSPFPIDHMRNQQVQTFLESEFNYLFLLDSDCEPPTECLTQLLDYDLDIVASVCPGIVEGSIVYTAATLDPEAGGANKFKMMSPRSPDLPTGLQEVDAVGATGVLIKRAVLEKMKYPWFKVLYKPDGSGVDSGEDFFFCTKAKELGFKIWADFSIVQKHFKVVSI